MSEQWHGTNQRGSRPRRRERSSALWWQRGIIYQIYPRSFMDANGDGVGDLRGIAERLDYLEWLGVDAVWISPFYPSPMADFGYDVADYTGVDPLFGTLADFEHLIGEIHRRGMRCILDLVPNHTSEAHPWFLESRRSRSSPKRDWYLWHDPSPDGGPPNNWLSVFGGSAWELDETTGQYYYHAFLKEQPDLNWRNPDVQAAMFDVMRWWLEKGVDGFRVDVIWHLIKDDELRDNPINPDFIDGLPPHERLSPAFSANQPEVHERIAAMRQLVDQYDERVLIGEVYLPVHALVTYYGQARAEAHLPFNFQLITLPWNALRIAAAVSEYEASIPPDEWPNWVLGNHDNPRIASRVGREQARVAALLLLFLKGTPTMYYGDELGMRDVVIPVERMRDPQYLRQGGKGKSRDPARTPMRWTGAPTAGFTAGEPWLPIGDDLETVNVAAQRDDPGSFLSMYRRLIALRRREDALSIGRFIPIVTGTDTLAWVREHDGRRFLIAANLGHDPDAVEVQLPYRCGTVMFATATAREGERYDGRLELHGDEGLVIQLDP